MTYRRVSDTIPKKRACGRDVGAWPPLGNQDFTHTLRELASTEEFRTWNHGAGREDAVLQVTGNFDGTKLASALAACLHADNKSNNVGIACTHIDLRDTNTRMPRRIISALAAELAGQNRAFRTQLDYFRGFNGQLSCTKLRHLFETATMIPSRRVFGSVLLVIGGVEGLLPGSEEEELVREVEALTDAACGAVRVILVGGDAAEKDDDTVRGSDGEDEQWDVESEGNNVTSVDIAVAQEDVARFVRDRVVDRFPLASSAVREGISKKLIETSETMFFMVDVQLEYLSRQSSDAELEKAMQRLPYTPRSLLDTIFQHVSGAPESHRKLLARILLWVFGAKRPLTIDELTEAVLIDCIERQQNSTLVTKESIAQLTYGLVVVDVHRTVGFANAAVRDYLSSSAFFTDQRFHVDAELAKVCLEYLLDSGAAMAKNNRLLPLYSYASQYWNRHACGLDTEDSELLALETSYLFEQPHSPNTYRNAPALSIHYAARHGLVGAVRELIRSGADPNERSERYGSPLQAASETGQLGVVLLLLEDHEDVLVDSPELEAAVLNGHLEVFKALLGRITKYVPMREVLQGLYEPSLRGGHRNIIQHFIQLGFPVSKHPVEALVAVGGDHREIYLLLLNAGLNINADCGISGSALVRAIRSNNIGFVAQLLSRGANVNAWSDFDTPLSAAAISASWDLIRLLLDHGARLKNSGALQKAAAWSSQAVVQKLLDEGAEVNDMAVNLLDESAVQRAAEKGRRQMVEFLLEKGADPNLPAQHGGHGNALIAATKNGYPEVADVLRTWGAK